MNVEELAWVCQEAARDMVEREERPFPPAVVLPSPQATRIVTLPEFPDDERSRLGLMESFAEEEILAKSQPAYGFLSEAEVDGDDVLIAVYGAHSTPPQITAAPLAPDGDLGEFNEPEPLDPNALLFIHALQHAVDQVDETPETPGIPGFGDVPGFGNGTPGASEGG